MTPLELPVTPYTVDAACPRRAPVHGVRGEVHLLRVLGGIGRGIGTATLPAPSSLTGINDSFDKNVLLVPSRAQGRGVHDFINSS